MFKAPALLCAAAALALLGLCAPALADCDGRNMIDELPAATAADLRAAAAQYPYAIGNYWQASKGNWVIHLVGTYHFDDPRHAAALKTLRPVLADAALLLVEAGPEEEAALKARMTDDPSLMVITKGPTLPEQLQPDDWQALSSAMSARGIPGVMAAKLRPWYVSMMLSIPPCAMTQATSARGLDGQLIDAALAQGIAVRALEPYDTVLKVFDTLSPQDQLDMITSALVQEDRSADLAATLADGYFAGESRLIWEFNRYLALQDPDIPAEKINADYAEMEKVLMADRNRSWIPVIEKAARKGPVLVAFGALHLSGKTGVLNLLARDGYTITQLPLGAAP